MPEERSKPGIIPRQAMPEQNPADRTRNFNEVALGYTEEQAVLEASRCLGCKRPLCVDGCPVKIAIPEFISAVRRRDFAEAARIVRSANSLPAICGRVCPQEEQCEQVCVLARKFEPVAIGRLERFIADWEAAHSIQTQSLQIAPPSGFRVAVVGSGPAGLTAAGELAKMGHDVTVFEALHEPGGVLVYGIPEFRLPKRIVKAEVDYLRSLGVRFKVNTIIGRTLTVDDLMDREGFDAVFLGTGAGLPVFLNIPGENLNGVYSANEFLTRVNLMKAYLFPQYDTPVRVGKRVAVIGGGNTAMDSARTALRLGPDKVFLIYRRSRTEMPARVEEIQHGEEEGIEFMMLTNPVRFIGENGWLKAVECIRMELGEPDESGRRRPVPVPGSEFVLEIDTCVVAVGNRPNALVPSTTPGLETGRHGTVVVDEATCATTRPGVFAGGDIVTGAATVILAMGAGKRAAAAIDEYLRSRAPSRLQPAAEPM